MVNRDFREVIRARCDRHRWISRFVVQVALLGAAAPSGEEEGEVSPELLDIVPKSLEAFDAGMNDDLNTPR